MTREMIPHSELPRYRGFPISVFATEVSADGTAHNLMTNYIAVIRDSLNPLEDLEESNPYDTPEEAVAAAKAFVDELTAGEPDDVDDER